MQCDLLSILTPFLKESDEKFESAARKTNFEVGVWGDQEIYILVKLEQFY